MKLISDSKTKFISIIIFIMGILDITVGLLFLIFGYFGKNQLAEFIFLTTTILIFGFLILTIGLIKLLSSWGILHTKRWAWYLIVYSSTLISFVDLLVFLADKNRAPLFLIINGFIVLYLLRQKTRKLFFNVR